MWIRVLSLIIEKVLSGMIAATESVVTGILKCLEIAETPESRDRSSNGKSSIVKERLHSFFFASIQTRTKLRFFSFFSSSQSLTKTFVSLRSCKI
jgi:hypothetical protein